MTAQQNPSQAQDGDTARPDFLQMNGAQTADSDDNTDNWYGWPHRKIEPVTLQRPDGKTERVRTPVMELEGLITPTELHYVVQHFGVPETVSAPKLVPLRGRRRSKSPCACPTMTCAAFRPAQLCALSWSAPAATPPTSSISRVKARVPPAPRSA